MEFVSLIQKLVGSLTTIFIVVLLLFVSLIAYTLKPDWFVEETTDTAFWKPRSVETDLPPGLEGKLIKYGYQLVTETPQWMGPHAKSAELQYAGNNLACKNCHLQSGTQAGSASWVGVSNRFPEFSGRSNKVSTIQDRVNGCMERSMNGKRLPDDSQQMTAIVAYMEWLSDDVPTEKLAEYSGFPKIALPEIPADPIVGKGIYEKECQLCHGEFGQGVPMQDATLGYQYPPVWGEDSYNHGAGMHRVITAAEFIKGNMPYGQATWDNPKLTDEEAYHVAAYINSFARPMKSNAETDFPDRKLKPVSTPYGPWDDTFTAEQHKYGPFQPIIAYYQDIYGIKKSK
jgi:thiosulfate dehydrogenase